MTKCSVLLREKNVSPFGFKRSIQLLSVFRTAALHKQWHGSKMYPKEYLPKPLEFLSHLKTTKLYIVCALKKVCEHDEKVHYFI